MTRLFGEKVNNLDQGREGGGICISRPCDISHHLIRKDATKSKFVPVETF
jgi:hypothetical protein